MRWIVEFRIGSTDIFIIQYIYEKLYLKTKPGLHIDDLNSVR